MILGTLLFFASPSPFIYPANLSTVLCRYIMDFQCTSNFTKGQILDAQKSFPSGHTSVSVFSSVFMVVSLVELTDINAVWKPFCDEIDLILVMLLKYCYWKLKKIIIKIKIINNSYHLSVPKVDTWWLNSIILMFFLIEYSGTLVKRWSGHNRCC